MLCSSRTKPFSALQTVNVYKNFNILTCNAPIFNLHLCDAFWISVNESWIFINLLCICTCSSSSTCVIYTAFKVYKSLTTGMLMLLSPHLKQKVVLQHFLYWIIDDYYWILVISLDFTWQSDWQATGLQQCNVNSATGGIEASHCECGGMSFPQVLKEAAPLRVWRKHIHWNWAEKSKAALVSDKCSQSQLKGHKEAC